jgi:hypothetical protein
MECNLTKLVPNPSCNVEKFLTPKGPRPFFGPIFEVWAGHCGCNICPKNLIFSVNMWFSTTFKTH